MAGFVIVTVGLVWIGSALTHHGTGYSYIYAGPKTWLPGYWEDTNYDFAGDRFYANKMENLNPDGCYRVAFIDTSGGWRRSELNCSGDGAMIEPSWNYTKKALCKNISNYAYTAACRAWRVHPI